MFAQRGTGLELGDYRTSARTRYAVSVNAAHVGIRVLKPTGLLNGGELGDTVYQRNSASGAEWYDATHKRIANALSELEEALLAAVDSTKE